MPPDFVIYLTKYIISQTNKKSSYLVKILSNFYINTDTLIFHKY
ncbi:MAG: hypothetical protein ACLSV2_15615 [Clostridium sp.]